MRDTFPLLRTFDFPTLTRGRLETVQANLGYRCNQACLHCHVAASPKRTEEMSWKTMEELLAFAGEQGASILDLTGGAPELNVHFRQLVLAAREAGLRVIDRCNLTILGEPGQEDLAEFLAANEVEITASLPCYLEENVNRQRGEGVFAASIEGLRRLNALGYGQARTTRVLNLVYNPLGASLPPDQQGLEASYKEQLLTRYGIVFSQLFALANMPIQRFGSQLLARGEFHSYMATLKSAHRDDNLAGVMCRSLISVDWEGYVYDCDFNQMLGMPLGTNSQRIHLTALRSRAFDGAAISVAGHCYGCTAGQGSSCGGAFATSKESEATHA